MEDGAQCGFVTLLSGSRWGQRGGGEARKPGGGEVAKQRGGEAARRRGGEAARRGSGEAEVQAFCSNSMIIEKRRKKLAMSVSTSPE